MLERLGDPAWHDRLVDSLEHLFPGRNEAATFTWIGAEHLKHLEGMSFADAAARMDMSVSDLTLKVMRESGLHCGFRDATPASPSVVRQMEADVIALLSRDDYMVGSDGIPFDEGVPHPRAYGTFPKIVGRAASSDGRVPGAPGARHDLVAGEPVWTHRSRRRRRGQVSQTWSCLTPKR